MAKTPKFKVGIKDGTSPVSGQIGEYLEALCTTITATTVAGDAGEVDVVGLSLTLTPGRWLVGFSIDARLNNNSGGELAVNGKVRLTDNSNVVVGNAIGFMVASSPTGAGTGFTMARQAPVSIDSNTTYKVRIACSVATASGNTTVGNTSITGSYANPDNQSILWAMRIA